jgi:2-methylcitrate dehydratase PrpD
MAGLLEPVGEWADQLRRGPLPDPVRHHACRAVVDWFAATVPGGTMPPARILRAALSDVGPGSGAVLVPGGEPVPARTAALINGTAAHTAELDDIFRDGAYHPGAPTIAAALAVAQQLGRTGAEFLTAVVVGFELGTRVAATIQPAHYKYWHTTGTVGTLGAAAAVATLLRLEPAQFAHAVSTSVTMAAGLQQAFRSDAMSKPLHAGHAAEAGTLAALAAGHGFTGADAMLEGPAGFGAAMSDGPDWTHVFDDLGSRYHITEMTFKNHACCGHTFAPIDAAVQARAELGIDPDRVARVEVATYRTAIDVAGIPDPTTDFEAKFSIPYCVAAALRLGSVRLAAFSEENLRDPRLRELTKRVELSVDPELDRRFPGQRGARVRFVLDDGASHEIYRPTRKGDPDEPLSDQELTDKFRELVTPHLGEGPTALLERLLWHLGDVDDLRALLPGSERA